jgi:hypothetical protein
MTALFVETKHYADWTVEVHWHCDPPSNGQAYMVLDDAAETDTTPPRHHVFAWEPAESMSRPHAPARPASRVRTRPAPSPRRQRGPVDRQMEATALLADRLAEVLPLVRDHVANEIARFRVAGYPSQAIGAEPYVGPPTKLLEGPCQRNHEDDPDEPCPHDRPCPVHDRPVQLTSVERAVEQVGRIQSWYADLEAQQKVIAMTVADALRSCETMLGMRVTIPVRLCDCRGREGASIPRAEGGWSDPSCKQAAEKSGLCDACYMREYRWRKANDLEARDRADLRDAV